MIVSIILLLTPKVCAASNIIKLGDVNTDGNIDTSDLLIILRHIYSVSTGNRPEWFLTGDKYLAGDVNKDNKIDTTDLLVILRYIAAKNSTEIAKAHSSWLDLEKQVINKSTNTIVEATGITLDKSSLTIKKGNTSKLTAAINPSNTTNKTISFFTSNSNIATVNSSGTVKGIKAGTATITAKTVNGKTATCKVTVQEDKTTTSSTSSSSGSTTSTSSSSGSSSSSSSTIKATSLAFNPSTTLTLYVGETSYLNVTISPSNTTNKKVAWTSPDTSIVTVTSTGNTSAKIQAKKAGNVIVRATLDGKVAYKTIQVKAITATSLAFSPSNALTMYVGETSYLNVTIKPSNTTNKKVTWTSPNTSIATVTSTGNTSAKIQAKKAGNVIIRATLDGKVAYRTIVVKSTSVTSVTLNKKEIELKKGETYQLNATISPKNVTDTTITWTTSNTNIATVNNGKVTAKNAGTATITAKTKNGKTATCKVVVKIAVKSIGINGGVKTMYLGGKTEKIEIDIQPTNATNKKIRWSSSDTRIATVDSNGIVTAKGIGAAIIYARADDDINKVASAYIRVLQKIPVQSIGINGGYVGMKIGETYTLKIDIQPKNATNKKIRWSSSDTRIATVDSNGKVTAKGIGTAYIYAKADDNINKGASAKIVVSR